MPTVQHYDPQLHILHNHSLLESLHSLPVMFVHLLPKPRTHSLSAPDHHNSRHAAHRLRDPEEGCPRQW